MSTIDTAASRLIEILREDENLNGVELYENDFDSDLVGEYAGEVLRVQGLIVVFNTFAVMVNDHSFPTMVVGSIVENPVVREDYQLNLGPTPQPGQLLRSLQVGQRILSHLVKHRSYQSGRMPITLPKNALERVVAKSGRIQFDFRVNMPSNAN